MYQEREFKPSSYNVLIAEDEAITALSMSKHLQKLGYNISGIVSTGRELIQKAVSSPPDYILTDIILKDDIDGFSAAEAIMKKVDSMIIFITGCTDIYTLAKLKQMTSCSYIQKPCNPEQVDEKIRSLVSERNHKLIPVEKD